MLRALDRWAARLLLGAGGTLAAVSALFSSGSSGGRLVWIGVAALAVATAVVVGALAGLPRPSFSREAVVALGFFAAFVAWNGVSVIWSIEGDRSWAYFNRGLVYLAFAVVGLWLGPWVREWAYVLAGVLALPLGWALLGKAIPALGSSGRVARLSSPIGYWNALGLLFAMALPLALWLAARREHRHWLRAAGVVYVYALVVGLLLTYSRGGVLAAGAAVVLWLVLGSPRVESAAALLLGGGAGLGVAVWAFSRPGLSSDGQPHSVRVHDGAWFAVVFVLAAVAVAALAYLGSLAEERRPLTDARRRLVGRVALGVLAVGVTVGVIALVVETKPEGWFSEFTSQPTDASLQGGPQHLANVSSSSRWLWWQEAWDAWEAQPWRGTGAGTFELTHRLLRTNNIVVTEPHNVPLQFLSETGVVGFFFAFASIAAAGVGVARRVRAREPAVVALAVLAAAYVLHSLVDFDWDFVAVTGPVPALGRRAARRAGGAGRAADRLGAAAGRGGDRGRALAADAVVRGALDRLGALRAGGQAAARRLPRRARRPLAQPAGARPAAHAGPGSRAARRRPGRSAAVHRRGRAAAAELARVVGARQLRGGPAGLRPRDPGTRARGRAGPAQLAHHRRAGAG